MDADRIAAEIYDRTVNDWPGEMEFYHHQSRNANAILEIACGTGRIGIRLAQEGKAVFGFDLSPHMIDIARVKSAGMPNIDWAVTDMTSFDLNRRFDLVIIPGHSFQAMASVSDQLSCLASIRRHLAADGRLIVHVDHQDVKWLGGLSSEGEGEFAPGVDLQLDGGRRLRTAKRWSYLRATQTAVLITRMEETNGRDEVTDSTVRRPLHMHCYFRYELEHLFARAGFRVVSLFGDFWRGELSNDSSEMIWITEACEEAHPVR